ncbi:hypothetical protein [Mycolicibacterium helvum]|uniref:hypothetical protein n=1 Tax=Mycolicibacterium helvum TaxID=1534349 RepID=UPI0013D4D0D4|nr:hypothetical protein [Mycolicibacterium helvum]
MPLLHLHLENAASLIPPKGYCYANVATSSPSPAPPNTSDPVPSFDQVALAFIAEDRRRNITPRGIVIALSVGLVESNLKIYANPKVPASMQIPHNAVGYDSYSVGPCQQQVVMGANGWWWGDAATCMNPTSSSGLFYDRLVRFDYNSTAHTPGWCAAEIPQPAKQYRGRYDDRMAEAQQLYNRLANQAPDLGEWEALMASDDLLPSTSMFKTPGEPPKYTRQLVQAAAKFGHQADTIARARAGIKADIDKIALVAAGNGDPVTARDQDSIAYAQWLLADISGKTVAEIQAQLKRIPA